MRCFFFLLLTQQQLSKENKGTGLIHFMAYCYSLAIKTHISHSCELELSSDMLVR